MTSKKFDIDDIRARYALPDIVSSSHVKLRADGQEFWACCPFHGEKTSSFHLFPSDAGPYKYHCFGCGASGDVIDYVQNLYGVEFVEACKIITGDTENRREPIRYAEITDPYDGYDFKRPPDTTPVIRAGEKTPPILNPKRVNPETGKPKTVTYTPSMVFPYTDKAARLLGYVLRVEFDDKKITPGVWWTENKDAGHEGWSHGSYPSPRPLYGLDRLYANPQDQVLLVEGEKCADAGERLLANKPVTSISWMGGGKAISKVHWKSLKGRSVLIWPDNDKPGWDTTIGYIKTNKDGEPLQPLQWVKGLIEYCYDAGVSRLKVVHITPDSRPKGWDVADAETEGLDGGAIGLIIKDRVRQWSREKFEAHKKGLMDKALAQSFPDPPENEQEDEPSTPAPQGRRFDIDKENWRNHLVFKADGDGIKSNSLQNIALMLQYESKFAGVFAWNDFAKEVYIMKRPIWDVSSPKGKWQPRIIIDTDVTSAACWLEYCGIAPKINDVGKMIQRVAQHNSFNPVTDRLDTLKWDGQPRLFGTSKTPCMLTYYFGAEPTPANIVFGGKWMIGAVARAYRPGCKVDTMMVLEGKQGLKKSSAIKALADELGPRLFTDEISDPNSKDAALQMQGTFIIEIAELDAFRKAEITQIKSWMSRQVDRFRRPYGKIIEDFPRSCVFAGSVNPSGTGYLKDATGARRFWPVRCTSIDLEAIHTDAAQLWAEAVHMFKDGEPWWLEGNDIAEAEKVQAERYEIDPFGAWLAQVALDVVLLPFAALAGKKTPNLVMTILMILS